MNAVAELVTLQLDGRDIEARAGESILDAAKRHGVAIPQLCHQDGLRPAGNCRACMVEIDGERTLAASCCRSVQPGQKVQTQTERVQRAQRMVLELLAADQPAAPHTLNSELAQWCAAMGVQAARFDRNTPPPADTSHAAIAVHLDACIQCMRCVRACREVQVNDVIAIAGWGADTRIAFDFDDAMGASSCVGCGECVQACPTGALSPANGAALIVADREVDSVCPYCGVGCQLSYRIKDETIIEVVGRDGPANHRRLCVKGRYGFDYVHHRQRITTPLLRRAGVPKTLDGFDPGTPLAVFREASWDEALALAGRGLRDIRDQAGAQALAGFGSAKGSNEEAYLFQKLVRTGFGSNNVDHCTRLCHASSVTALLEGIGSGAVSNPVADVSEADVIMIVGANPTVNHPVAATFIKNAVKAGKTLIVVDPRRTEITRHAQQVLQFAPGADVALFNAMLHTIIDEGLHDRAFIDARTTHFDELRANVAACSPELMAPLAGVAAQDIRRAARSYATAKNAMILWGMGVSQHVHGTDNARCLIALALITGHIGRPGNGLHPLRGQNNVQGASDAGLIPMMFPDYQRVDDAAAHARFESAWGQKLDARPGLTVVEIIDAANAGSIKGMYVMGENPAMSDPDLDHARAGLAKLDHLVVQDLFLTETAAFADVFLPASGFPEKTGSFTNTDRRVQLGRQALQPPGDARQDLWIVQQMARQLGLAWPEQSVEQVYEEMRSLMPSITGISWQRLVADEPVIYPCADEHDPGQPVMFGEQFPLPGGKARLVPARFAGANELPDADYPMVLMTGRQLEHWHTGSMTRRSAVLDAIEPEAVISVHPIDLAALGVNAGATVQLVTRRGAVHAAARVDPTLQPGQLFMAFCYSEAAANLLTNPALDPFAKIPELKFCAARLEALH
ncbi:formate dehydrogenase subunit alpha [Piscinibacter sp.]|uniref:formate dehydrogenase subunit alpha n=1 Tax=Piscinibacter sp. TaxID=1903157 RepID=UPI003559E473